MAVALHRDERGRGTGGGRRHHARGGACRRATPALTLTAQNILTDLRAATAYDPDALAALAGRSIAFDADDPARAA